MLKIKTYNREMRPTCQPDDIEIEYDGRNMIMGPGPYTNHSSRLKVSNSTQRKDEPKRAINELCSNLKLVSKDMDNTVATNIVRDILMGSGDCHDCFIYKVDLKDGDLIFHLTSNDSTGFWCYVRGIAFPSDLILRFDGYDDCFTITPCDSGMVICEYTRSHMSREFTLVLDADDPESNHWYPCGQTETIW